MNSNQIREAAALLRAAWFKTDYICNGAVCVMGSLAKASDPSLTDAKNPRSWEARAHHALVVDPMLCRILEEEIDAVFAALPEKTPKQQHLLAKFAQGQDEIWRTGIKVCIANLTVFKSGEEAAAFLDRVADRHAQG